MAAICSGRNKVLEIGQCELCANYEELTDPKTCTRKTCDKVKREKVTIEGTCEVCQSSTDIVDLNDDT